MLPFRTDYVDAQSSCVKIATDARVADADVLHGFEEGIDLARSRGNPVGMLAGWREISKMRGYYAPERKEVHVSVAVSKIQQEMACIVAQ